MIVFPVKTNKENAAVSPLFGKAKYFAFYDGKKLSVEPNPYEKGTKLVDWFIEKGVDVLIIKEMGSKSFKRIANTNIKILYASEDRVTANEIIARFKDNKLNELSNEEFRKIIEKHESKKKEKSCCGNNHSHDKTCHKKMKAQNPYIFL